MKKNLHPFAEHAPHPEKEEAFNIHFMSGLVIILDFRKRFTMLRCLISIQSKE